MAYVFAAGGSGGVVVRRAVEIQQQALDPVALGNALVELLRIAPAAAAGNLFVELLQQLNTARVQYKDEEEVPKSFILLLHLIMQLSDTMGTLVLANVVQLLCLIQVIDTFPHPIIL